MPGSLARSLVHLRLSAMILTQLVTDMNAGITRETHTVTVFGRLSPDYRTGPGVDGHSWSMALQSSFSREKHSRRQVTLFTDPAGRISFSAGGILTALALAIA